MQAESIFSDLIINIKNNKYHGWDPYDIQSSKYLLDYQIPAKILLFITQFNKISPINFRNILHINKNYNSKAMALIASALLKSSYRMDQQVLDYCINWLIKSKSDRYDQYAVGFTYDIFLSHYASKKNSPSLIISLFAIYAFIEYWKVFNDKSILNYIHSFFYLIQEKLPKHETNEVLWYSYNFEKFNEIYNATAKIGKFYSLYYAINRSDLLIESISKILNYLLSKQRIDGSWAYGENIRYTDGFHTAFVLESIWYMRQLVDSSDYKKMFELGLKNYKENLFKANGQPLYFHPYYRPKDFRRFLIDTDIRDCAMAIVLFNLLGEKEYLAKTYNWTLESMYSHKNKYFFYYKNKLWTNKVEFLRWQAWMLYALSNVDLLVPSLST